MDKNTHFIINISKDELAALPVKNYRGNIEVIDSSGQIPRALKELRKWPVVGFDTETKPAFRKGVCNNVALMQIATEDSCFLFRINKIGLQQNLIDYLEDPAFTKIGLSLHDDFNVLNRSEKISPAGFIDLQTIVRAFEISDISLQKIYAILYGQRISKSQRLTNWEADVLTGAQKAYAALDAKACLEIYHTLSSGQFMPSQCKYRHIETEPEQNPI